jgi:hypothetical protein
MGSCQLAFSNPKGLSSLRHGESLLKEHKMKNVDANRTEKESANKK